MAKERILVVDDDPAHLALVEEILTGAGYQVKTVKSVFQAKGALSKFPPELMILDRGLGELEGLDLLKEIRSDERFQSLPVLLLTARNKVPDKVMGLSTGGDDYMGKPFSEEELLARVAALLRRTKAPPSVPKVLSVQGLVMDLDRHLVKLKGKELDLPPKEFELLAAFLERPGHVLSRRHLLQRVWGDTEVALNPKTVDVTVARLRATLGDWGKRLVAVKAYGYQLEADS
ncbi:MAG: response regulator transcription factor [Elusimicrobia bacterium]|nr:response regulator transcription factor [Elusimicrobiota bacterium]